MVNKCSCHTLKQWYKLDRIVCNMLKLASRVGTVSHSMYLALYYYRTGRYTEALQITYFTKQRLSQPYILYNDADRRRYSEAVGRMSLSKKMNAAWLSHMILRCEVHYIEELILEQVVGRQNGIPALLGSPFLISDMLLVLSHHRLGNRSQSLQSLTDIQTLLVYDDGEYVPLLFRDLSWQILGICQHVVGDLHGALQSYQESLRQESQYNNIQKATENRIMFLERQLHRNRQS
jgi:hypothetical protein